MDLVLPKYLHSKFNGFPLAPTVRSVSPLEFSEVQEAQFRSVFGKTPQEKEDSKTGKKLVGDLLPKSHYIIHHKLLKFLMEEGYLVTKVHRIMTFTEK